MKKVLIAALVFAALAVAGTHLLRNRLAAMARTALERGAAELGVGLSYASLSVGLDGVVRLEDVDIADTPLGHIAVGEVRADVDVQRALRGDLYFESIRVVHPRLRIDEALVEDLCRESGLCPGLADAQRADLERRVERRQNGIRATRRLSPRPLEAVEATFGAIELDDVQLEVAVGGQHGETYLALYQLDLRIAPQWGGRLHLTGSGSLVSVLAGSRAVGFTVSGSLDNSEVGVEVDMDEAVEIATPGGRVSFEQVGVLVGESADVWLGRVVVLPELLEFTDSWQAEAISATLSFRAGLAPEHVFVEGLKGELDLVALADFAAWLAEEPDETADTADVHALRAAVNRGWAELRGQLYGTDVHVQAHEGDVRLQYADGSTFSLATLDLAIGATPERSASGLSLSYEGQTNAGAKLASGSVDVRIGDLTPSRIANWSLP